MKHKTQSLVVITCLLWAGATAWAAGPEKVVATLDAHKLLSDSKVAKESLAKFQSDFLPKEKELQSLAASLKDKSAQLDKNAASLAPSQLNAKQSEIDELARDLKRKQQQFVEDRDARKRDDIQHVFSLATLAAKKYANVAHIDMVLQDAVYASPKTDITAKVIEVMDAEFAK